ncbi:hypothetical protein LCGC14_0586380 [marine sediment metagenome]|uniref:Uncharacterized protein n=1 Tax=marine sediment metagenome TaxID=412755 RepID=A0A0F9RYM7_9ZZZZ
MADERIDINTAPIEMLREDYRLYRMIVDEIVSKQTELDNIKGKYADGTYRIEDFERELVRAVGKR